MSYRLPRILMEALLYHQDHVCELLNTIDACQVFFDIVSVGQKSQDHIIVYYLLSLDPHQLQSVDPGDQEQLYIVALNHKTLLHIKHDKIHDGVCSLCVCMFIYRWVECREGFPSRDEYRILKLNNLTINTQNSDSSNICYPW